MDDLRRKVRWERDFDGHCARDPDDASTTPVAIGTSEDASGRALQPTSARTGANEGPRGPKRGPNDTNLIRTDIPGFVESFWSRVERVPDACWPWTAAKNGLGYGVVWTGEKLALAHRVAFTLAHGPIPRGLVIDHVCRNPSCANPEHLQLVTQRENMRRGISPNAIACRTGTCKHGHSLEDARIEHGRRRCRQCAVILQRKYRAARRAGA